MKRLLAAVFCLFAAACAPTKDAGGIPPGDGPLVGLYKAVIDDGSGTARRAKLSIWAELPDRLHAELVGPVGGVSFVLDAGQGRVCIVDAAAGEAYAGEDGAAAIGSLVGVPLSAADAVLALLSGSAPPEVSVTRDDSIGGQLPRTIRIAAGASSLDLTRVRYVRGASSSRGLGTGDPPPGMTVHPLEALSSSR